LLSDIMSGSGAVELLKFLGFHFQVKSENFVTYNFLVNRLKFQITLPTCIIFI